MNYARAFMRMLITNIFPHNMIATALDAAAAARVASSVEVYESLYSAVEDLSLDRLNDIYFSSVPTIDINHIFPTKKLPRYKGLPGLGSGHSILHLACWQGAPRPFVDRLIELGSDINLMSSDDKYTSLHCASFSGNMELVEFLIDDMGFSNRLEVKDSDGYTPLHHASIEGHCHIVKLLLDKGCNPNEKDFCSSTPLHASASYGRKAVVELLISRGGNIHAKADNSGYTPLHLASQFGHKDVVDFLINCGSNVNEKTNKGSTSLHIAAFKGKKEVIEILLSRGSNMYERNQNNWTARYMASINDYNPLCETIKNWPVLMIIVVLQELFAYPQLDLYSFVDLFQYSYIDDSEDDDDDDDYDNF